MGKRYRLIHLFAFVMSILSVQCITFSDRSSRSLEVHKEFSRNAIVVSVLTTQNYPISTAFVTMKLTKSGKEIKIPYEYEHSAFIIDSIQETMFDATITVSAIGFEPQSQRCSFNADNRKASFILGRSGSNYTYLGEGKVPYTSHPNRYTVLVYSDMDSAISVIRSLGLRYTIKEDGKTSYSDQRAGHRYTMGKFIFIEQDQPFDRFDSPILRILRSNKWTANSGPFIDTYETVLSNRFTLWFMPQATSEERNKLLSDTRFKKEAFNFRYSYDITSGVTLEVDSGMGEGINDLMEELLQNPAVRNVAIINHTVTHVEYR